MAQTGTTARRAGARKNRRNETSNALARLKARASDTDALPRIGKLQAMLMCAVAQLEDNAYAAQVIEWVERELGPPINGGQVQTALERLTELGYLDKDRDGKPGPRGGRPVFTYSITPLGRDMIKLTDLYLDALSSKGATNVQAQSPAVTAAGSPSSPKARSSRGSN